MTPLLPACLRRPWALALVLLLPATARTDTGTVSLAGEWNFALDRANTGVAEQWFDRDLEQHIKLPGLVEAQGFGDPIATDTPWVLSLYDRFWYLRADFKAYAEPGKVKVPFLSQPPRHYVGVSWYERKVAIPAAWQGRRIGLHLERTRWESSVWLDGTKIGSVRSLVAPHDYDLGILTPGTHRLAVRLDTHMLLPYRPDGHAVSDSLDAAWNGIVGAIELHATSPVWISDAQVFPDVATHSAHIKVLLGNAGGSAGRGTISAGGVSQPIEWDTQGGAAELDVPLGDRTPLWDEFHPVLQHLALRLSGPGAEDRRDLSFGLRDFRTQGQDFVINGRIVNLRGTHNGGDFPLTGSPATDIEYWRKLFRLCREWGLNSMRFHSWCPPEAAFTAADEVGFYLQPEAGMWNPISPGSDIEKELYAETDRMLRAYGNHPSFVMLSASNEPAGRYKEALPAWVAHYHAEDPRHLYAPGTGWNWLDAPGPVKGADYLVNVREGRFPLRGASAWFGGDFDAALQGVDVPMLAHELGQWCAFPDFSVIKKFTGYMRPGNYEIFRDSMADHGLLGRDRDFAQASGRYQVICYKEDIEANLRTKGMAGYQLLDLHDYVGQGTALVGILDTFWQNKGYIQPSEWRRFGGATVPLARLRQRVYTTADTLAADVEMAHYGLEPLTNVTAGWRVVNTAGKTVAAGAWPATTIPIGKNFPLGRVTVDLAKLAAPQAYKLVAGIEGTAYENDWNFWVYPAAAPAPAPADVLVTTSWDQAAARLAAGGKVLLLPRAADLGWTSPPLDTQPVFWNRLMSPNWSRMLGLWNDIHHPALAEFPTEANCDWQWSELLQHVRAINLGELPRALQPIVQPIDDWNRNWKLALVFECRVGAGRLLVCSADIATDLAARPVARQLRQSLLDYMRGPKFAPKTAVAAEALGNLWYDSRIMRHLGATVHADGANADALIDGDPNTFWAVGLPAPRAPTAPALTAVPPREPRTIIVSFPAPVSINGLELMTRQNDRNHTGDIRGFTIDVSQDGVEWRRVADGELASTFEPQAVRFGRSVTVRYVKLTALSGFGTDPATALSELAVLYTGPKLAADDSGTVNYKRVRSTSGDVIEGAPAALPPARKD